MMIFYFYLVCFIFLISYSVLPFHLCLSLFHVYFFSWFLGNRKLAFNIQITELKGPARESDPSEHNSMILIHNLTLLKWWDPRLQDEHILNVGKMWVVFTSFPHCVSKVSHKNLSSSHMFSAMYLWFTFIKACSLFPFCLNWSYGLC